MADFVANTAVSIDHHELGTYASTASEWADVLARNGLRIVDCVDVSDEIANSLDDPEFDANLERLGREGLLTEIVRKNLRSFNNYGKALRRRILDYILFIVQKDRYLPKDEILRINEEKLGALVPYAEGLRRSTWIGSEGEPEADEAPSRDCLYRIEWESKELPHRDAPSVSRGEAVGSWIVFVDAEGIGEQLETSLKTRGAGSILVCHGDGYQRLSTNRFQLRPDVRQDFERLLTDLDEAAPARLLGAVHLWSLDAAPPEKIRLDSLAEAQSLGCASVVHWIQSIAQRDGEASPRLWIVTPTLRDDARLDIRLSRSGASFPLGLGSVDRAGAPGVMGRSHRTRCARPPGRCLARGSRNHVLGWRRSGRAAE